jgi:hypothetical protein
MKNAIAAEFLKMRRSRVLLLAFIAAAAPPAVKMLRTLLAPAGNAADWRTFLSSGQELTVFSLLIAVLLIANYVFTMEYKLHTAAAIFTAQTRRAAVYAAKMACLFLVIPGMVLISAAAQLLFGAVSVSGALPGDLLKQFLEVTLWYAASFSLLAAVVALAAVLARRFVLTAVITLGYYILLFPFHAKTLYVCFFMTPVVVAARLYGSANYIFSFDYRGMDVNLPQAAVFLLALAAVSVAAGIFRYRTSDVPN